MRQVLYSAQRVLLVCLAIILGMEQGRAQSGSQVHFDAAVLPPSPFSIKLAKKQNRTAEPVPPVRVWGFLSKPDGEGPFPAVVLMHGCSGISTWDEVWSKRLRRWGYVVLDVDSFTPRKARFSCSYPLQVPGPVRALDAHGAKRFLQGLPEVDNQRIAVMGMSHGGWSALSAVERARKTNIKSTPFRASVTLYPWCDEPAELDAPVLILIGELDDWTPANRCREFAAGKKTSDEVALKVYPDAHHLFDLHETDEIFEGHVLRYNRSAASDAIARVKRFLEEHLLQN